MADTPFAAHLRALRDQRGLSVRALAGKVRYGKSHIHDLATGRRQPTPDIARRLDDALGAGGELVALANGAAGAAGDEVEALELARRVTASDVSAETLDQLERVFDDLATAYTATPPGDLLPRIRTHLTYVGQLMDAKTTLAQQRRLVTLGAWLSLLAATVHIDLRQHSAAYARLGTAATLAEHADHPEIRAWCLETQAWDVLTGGDYRHAVDLAQQAQAIAPAGSSAHIQATAQEGRAWARLHRQAETRAVLDRVDRLTSSLPVPDRPEHHYRYDPSKADSYKATTLAWAWDPAAEELTRAVIAQLESAAAGGLARPRRLVSARLDLGLALLAADKPDEAAAEALAAVTSGRVVPSNWWRAAELAAGVERTGIPEAVDLRDACEVYQPGRG